jgi:hypothetical protein
MVAMKGRERDKGMIGIHIQEYIAATFARSGP